MNTLFSIIVGIIVIGLLWFLYSACRLAGEDDEKNGRDEYGGT